ncbi:WD40 repeat-like protein [Aspergillus steynii IBT 23096]|uniref:WD40 repeat-like protein n=1 Tax=Aspergillus steynii IBT 23096 TaxID=1392250 RepID=A0A2I2FZD2_9EURO|nr:WD40 repeat-like protein [Aspergillus steynii IBT 23096]PLB46000.1 WD40 repeat-like protein [Aspergillus steynii IBT 23096]
MFSPGCQLLASGSVNGRVNIWEKDTTTWNLKWTFPGANQARFLSFSSDDLLLASSTTTPIIHIWNMRTGKIHQKVQQPDDVEAVSFSQDNRFLVSGSDETIRLWDTATWGLKQTIYTEGDRFALSPDNKYIASREELTTIIRVRETGAIIQSAKSHSAYPITALAFSSDSRLMASSGYDNTIRLRSVTREKSQQDLDGHADAIFAHGFSPDGSLVVTGGLDCKVKIWDAGTGKVKKTLEVETSLEIVAISPNNELVATSSPYESRDGKLLVWKAETGERLMEEVVGRRDEDLPIHIEFCSDNRLLCAVSRDRTITVWDTKTGDLVKKETNEILESVLNSFQNDFYQNDTKGNQENQMSLEAVRPVTPPLKCQISIEDNWVISGNQKSIWLPPDFRPAHGIWDFRNNTLVVGTSNNRVYFIWFNPEMMSAEKLQIPSEMDDYSWESTSSLQSFIL